MRMLKALVAAIALAGCAASSYGDGSRSITGGFYQEQISETVWRVSYFGNAYASDETVQTYWLYRAAELTLEQGYDGFRILSNVRLTQTPSAAMPARFQPGEARFIPIVQSGLDGKPYMIADISLLRAPVPEQPRITFDARALQTFLAPYVHGELCGTNVCPHVHRYLFPGFAAPAAGGV
jgi:hypothetical protein